MTRIATAIEYAARIALTALVLVTGFLLTHPSPAAAQPSTMNLTVRVPADLVAPTAGDLRADPVKVCRAALVRAHHQPTARMIDRATVTCSRLIVTQHQADRLYAWVYNGHNKWALAIIG